MYLQLASGEKIGTAISIYDCHHLRRLQVNLKFFKYSWMNKKPVPKNKPKYRLQRWWGFTNYVLFRDFPFWTKTVHTKTYIYVHMYEINREGDRGRREENYMEKGTTGPSNTKRGSGGLGRWKIYFSLDHQQFTFSIFLYFRCTHRCLEITFQPFFMWQLLYFYWFLS